ncbi:hypothetical protein D3C78_544390 [compost metagenome]
MIRDGFFGGGRGATSSEWSSRAGSVGFVDLEQGKMGGWLGKGLQVALSVFPALGRGCL